MITELRTSRTTLVIGSACCYCAGSFCAGHSRFSKAVIIKSGADAVQRQLPSTFDVRGPNGVPRGYQLAPANCSAIESDCFVANAYRIEYPGALQRADRNAQPLIQSLGYLSAPSNNPPETIARNFLTQWKGIFGFSQGDLISLRLKSRATVPDLSVTILSFEQQASQACPSITAMCW